MQGPREERLCWADHHMLLALITSFRSPDPNTQVGAVFVDKGNHIVATGYNAFPKGISTTQFPWNRKAEHSYDTKYPYVVHAEKNGINNAIGSLEGTTCYVTLFPCASCATDLIQKGVSKVVYLDDKYRDTDSHIAATRMFEHLDIPTKKHQWNKNSTIPYLKLLNQII